MPLIFRFMTFILLIAVMVLNSCDDDSNVLVQPKIVANTNFSASEPFSYKLDVVNQSQLDLEGINGNVNITGKSGFHSVIIKGEKRVESESTEDAADYLPLLEVSIRDLSGKITVKTLQPQETFGRNCVVDYTIILPDNFEILASNVNGSVVIDTISNLVSVDNVNGQVILNTIYGTTYVNLANGQIAADITLPSEGIIDLSTVNGGISLDIPQNTSAELSAQVTNGGINIYNLDLQNNTSTLKSVSGTLADGRGTISLNTVNGFIQVSGF